MSNVSVSNIEELCSTINNSANKGNTIVRTNSGTIKVRSTEDKFENNEISLHPP